MNTTRNGKIARLPKAVREKLNRRLADGEMGADLVIWLNGLPEVQAIVAKEFDGRPIREQNLSEWRAGGYEDWVRQQESLDWARNLVEESEELANETSEGSLADNLSTMAVLSLGRCLRTMAAEPQGTPEQFKKLVALCQELAKLRHGDHEAEQVRLKRERWHHLLEEELREMRSEAASRPLHAMILAKTIRGLYERDIEKAGGEIPPELLAYVASSGKFPPAAEASESNFHVPNSK